MYDKGDVIRAIGFRRWDMFLEFMSDKPVEWDDYMDERVFHPQNIDDFKKEHGSR